jgi:hypothetical protein
MTAVRMNNLQENLGTSGSPFGQGDVAPKTTLIRNPGVLFKVRPDRWEVYDGRAILPCPAEIHLGGGTSNVTLDKNTNRPNATRARASAEDRGWTVIPLAVLGAGTSYLKQHSEFCWLPFWCVTYAGSSSMRIDHDQYIAFWQKLIDLGVIAPPSVTVLQALRNSLYRQGRNHQRAKDEDRAARFFSDVRVIDAELNRRAKLDLAADPASFNAAPSPLAEDDERNVALTPEVVEPPPAAPNEPSPSLPSLEVPETPAGAEAKRNIRPKGGARE